MEALENSTRTMGISKRLIIFSSIFLFSQLIFMIGVEATNIIGIPNGVSVKYFVTTTITNDDRVFVKFEISNYNNNAYPVNFTPNIQTNPANVINQFILLQNGTNISLPDYSTATPRVDINLKGKGDSYLISLNWESLGSLEVNENGIHHFHDSYGSPDSTDFFQFRLKIQKKTDLFHVLTYSTITKIKSNPENSGINNNDPEYQVVSFDSPNQAPNVVVVYDYKYDHDIFQFALTLLYLGLGGLIVKIYSYLRNKRKNKKSMEKCDFCSGRYSTLEVDETNLDFFDRRKNVKICKKHKAEIFDIIMKEKLSL